MYLYQLVKIFMKAKNLNAKNTEETQRTAEFDIPVFLCGSLRKPLRFSAVKIQLIITKRH